MFAKETPERLDRIKAGEFALTLWRVIIAKIIPWELFFSLFLRDSVLLKCPGQKDIFKELRVRFVIFPKIIISE